MGSLKTASRAAATLKSPKHCFLSAHKRVGMAATAISGCLGVYCQGSLKQSGRGSFMARTYS